MNRVTLPQKLPRIVMTDIDGVWTDGGMYYDQRSNELKKFNTSDSAGILFLRHLKIPVAILTGETTEIVSARAKKLQIRHVYQGVQDKVATATELCDSLGFSLSDAAYIGDDLNDMQLLQSVGLSGAPANAPVYVREIVDIVTSRRGGDGAFREFVELMLSGAGLLSEVVAAVTGVAEGLHGKWQ